MSLTSKFATIQSKLRAARLAADAYAKKLLVYERARAKSVTAALALETALASAADDLDTAIAALTYPTVTIAAVVYQCVLASVEFEGVTYTAEDVAADAVLAADMLAAGSLMLSRGLVANFTGTPLSGEHPETVTFTNTTTGTPTSYAWTFGDGDTSTEASPTHIYEAAGTYNVTLTVTNAYGSDAETKTSYVVIS